MVLLEIVHILVTYVVFLKFSVNPLSAKKKKDAPENVLKSSAANNCLAILTN